jgi:hypothetical protein
MAVSILELHEPIALAPESEQSIEGRGFGAGSNDGGKGSRDGDDAKGEE